MTFVKITEQPSSHGDLDKMSVRELLEGINDEDARVAPAVRRTIPQLEKLVTAVVERMRRGGRIFYLGAGTSGRLGVLDASEIPPTFGMPPSLVVGLIAGGDRALRNPVEFAEDDEERGWEELRERSVSSLDTVIGIAASGTSPGPGARCSDGLHHEQPRLAFGCRGRYSDRDGRRTRVCDGQLADEVGNRAEDDLQHDYDGDDDSSGPGAR